MTNDTKAKIEQYQTIIQDLKLSIQELERKIALLITNEKDTL
jgi:uncharacterized small protein (DUF1192 family)